MTPVQLKREDPVEQQVEGNCEETHEHGRLATIERIEGVDEHLERCVSRQSDGIEAQSPAGRGGVARSESTVLVHHRHDGLGEHHESDGRGDGQKKHEPHGACELDAKADHVPRHHQPRQQRQGDRAERHTEQTEGQLHQAKSDRKPEDRTVAQRRGKYRVGEHVELGRARRDDRRTHQRQNRAHPRVTPSKVG